MQNHRTACCEGFEIHDQFPMADTEALRWTLRFATAGTGICPTSRRAGIPPPRNKKAMTL